MPLLSGDLGKVRYLSSNIEKQYEIHLLHIHIFYDPQSSDLGAESVKDTGH
jgi:hypothetical protein